MTTRKVLFDTCVFIDFYRSTTPTAGEWIEKVIKGQIDGLICPIVDFELWCGVKNNVDAKRHRIMLAKFRRMDFHVTIARRAGFLHRQHSQTFPKGPSAPDFIIAATAEYYHADILTANLGHFNQIPITGPKIIPY